MKESEFEEPKKGKKEGIREKPDTVSDYDKLGKKHPADVLHELRTSEKDLSDEEANELLEEYVVNLPTSYFGNKYALDFLSELISRGRKAIAKKEGVDLTSADKAIKEKYEEMAKLKLRDVAYRRAIKMLEQKPKAQERHAPHDNRGEMTVCILGRFLPIPSEHVERIKKAEEKYYKETGDIALKEMMDTIWRQQKETAEEK